MTMNKNSLMDRSSKKNTNAVSDLKVKTMIKNYNR